MNVMASQITCVSIVCSTVCSDADQRTHQSSASLAFVRGIHRWPVESHHKRPVTRKMFLFDDVIMYFAYNAWCYLKSRCMKSNVIGHMFRFADFLNNVISHFDPSSSEMTVRKAYVPYTASKITFTHSQWWLPQHTIGCEKMGWSGCHLEKHAMSERLVCGFKT